MSKKRRSVYVITRDKFFTPEQAQHLLKTCNDLSEIDLLHGRSTWVTRTALVGLLLRSGLRISEAANLKLGEIHLNGKDNYLTVLKGKGSRRRDVYINQTLVRQLKHYIEVKKKSWRMSVAENDYLFSHGPKGKRYSTTGLFLSFRKAVKRAGLPNHLGHPHACRHTFATLFLQDTNGDIRACQAQLGHQSLSMSALYCAVLPQRRQELADRLSI
jgi:site-specific recombinase XerD